jgi:large subunit ribosomal protein L29
MRADEIRELTQDDIKSRVAELEEERFRLRFRSATEPLENPLRLRTIRKDIARLKTILTQKQRGQEVKQRDAGSGTRAAKATKATKAKKSSKERVKNG